MNQVAAKKQENKAGNMFASFTILILIVVAWLIYLFVFGNKSNFQDGNPENHPVADGVGHFLGLIYKGGYVVPFLLSFVLMNITFSIERFLTIQRAAGSGSAEAFVRRIKGHLLANNVDAAIAECDKQKGSVANVIKSALGTYKAVENDATLNKEQKILAIQKEIEEATSLELPMLEKNLVIIATMASVSTLVALLGTVLGMIRAFSALGTTGAPDSAALATGISEALINTALGIFNSAIAIIMYNVFTTRIDKITYTIDEAGFTIVQNFAAQHKS